MEIRSSSLALSATYAAVWARREQERLEVWRGDQRVISERDSSSLRVVGSASALVERLGERGLDPVLGRSARIPPGLAADAARGPAARAREGVPTARPFNLNALVHTAGPAGLGAGSGAAGEGCGGSELEPGATLDQRLWIMFMLLTGDEESAMRLARSTARLARAYEGRPDPALEAVVARAGAARSAKAQPEAASAPEWGVRYNHTVDVIEAEATTFAATGTITTADGREISVAVTLAMARTETAHFEESVRLGAAAKDPLVLNFTAAPTALTAERQSFDLDSDGTADSIATLAPNSGYLVLDRDANGAATNGSELFGPNSGDGYVDLAAYDLDRNGWIDGADAVFAQLSVWSPAQGDGLVSLADAGVGAISLARTATPFSLTDGATGTLGQIADTGLFLYEDGRVGTLQRIDLVA